MIRLWLAFAIIAVLVHFGLTAWRNMNGKEKWTLTKSAGYSIIVASLALVVMVGLVILF
jgi:hypothetical protein